MLIADNERRACTYEKNLIGDTLFYSTPPLSTCVTAHAILFTCYLRHRSFASPQTPYYPNPNLGVHRATRVHVFCPCCHSVSYHPLYMDASESGIDFKYSHGRGNAGTLTLELFSWDWYYQLCSSPTLVAIHPECHQGRYYFQTRYIGLASGRVVAHYLYLQGVLRRVDCRGNDKGEYC